MLLTTPSEQTPTRRLPPDLARLLGDARGVVLGAFAAALKPVPEMTVSEWADEKRYVAEESSPNPGKWRTGLVPYMREVMDVLSPSDPCREVAFCKSHQIGGTEGGINFFGHIVDMSPGPTMIVLPTLDEAKKYNKIKLDPAVQSTPVLRQKVRNQKSRDSQGSTTLYKKFNGGYLVMTGANSSAGLQMASIRNLILEEVSEFPDDVDGRGDPVALALKRTTAFSESRKVFYVSTPGIKGVCRVTQKYEASDQRKFYVQCPECNAWQLLKFDAFKWDSDQLPYGGHFECRARECRIGHHHKTTMAAGGVWIKTYPTEDGEVPMPVLTDAEFEHWSARGSSGRFPGFHIWQAYSPFPDWDDLVHDWLGAKNDPHEEKVFCQQVLGQAWEEKGEAPDHEKLLVRREGYRLGTLPPGAMVLTGMADVQGNRLEWAVYGWGIGQTGWLVDKGIIEGDPAEDDVWRRLDEVIARSYETPEGKKIPIDAFAVDAGYLSHRVYMFCRGRPNVLALDGRAGALLPFIGTPKKVDISWAGKIIKGGTLLWPTGTWPLKSWVYGAFRKTINGPDEDGTWPLGCLRYPDACDEEYFKQLTAEYLAEVEKNGRAVQVWKKISNQPNEALDIVVGARALAYHLGLDRLTRDEWQALALDRGVAPDDVQRDMAALWSPGPVATATENTAPPPRPAEVDGGDGWVRPNENWMDRN